jgi:methionyl-tRNA formyltransferase
VTRRAKAPSRVRTIFIGTGAFGAPALRRLATAPGVELVGVVTGPARPAGRGVELMPSPIGQVSGELGVGVIQRPERLRRPDAIAGVLARRPELIVLADYGQIVPRALLDVPHGALNLHPSLLPRHRGASPIPATILAGEAKTGVALMRMDDGLDTGPIVAVEEVDLAGDEIAPDLERRLAERAAGLLARSLGPWVSGALRARPQATEGASLTRPLRRDDGRLDPSRSAVDLERQIRAFQPWPGSWFVVPSGRFIVGRAAVRRDVALSPGELRVERGDLLLGTPDGALELVEIQPAGGRRMTGAEAVRGRPGLLLERVEGPPGGLEPGPFEWPVG